MMETEPCDVRARLEPENPATRAYNSLMRSRAAAVLGLVSLMLVPVASQNASRGRQTAPARAEAAVPFKVGETLTYDVSWSMLLTAGTAVATVRERRSAGGSTAYSMDAEGRPVPLVARLYPISYKIDTLLDTYLLQSYRSTFVAEEKSSRKTAVTTFDRPRRRVNYELTDETKTTSEYSVPPDAQDGLAAFYLLRARGVKTGERFSIPVADSGTVFTASFNVGPVEQIKVPYTTTTAWNIQVSLTDSNNQLVWKNTALWMTNDARRLPIKLQAELPVGHFVLALKEVR